MATLRAKSFDYGTPKILAFKAPGENVDGQYCPQVKFVTTGGDWLYLDCEPASDIEREMQELGIRHGEQFRMTRAKTSHGGSRFVVERLNGRDAGGHNVPDRVLEAQLEKSIEMARDRGRTRDDSPEPPVPAITPASARLCAALKTAIDASVEAAAYAGRLGIRLQFGEEDIRCMALSVYVNECSGER